MIFDIQLMKDMGFNMLRKHIKIEPMRWYYHCDRLGMLVWQDMPSGGGHIQSVHHHSARWSPGLHRRGPATTSSFAAHRRQGRGRATMRELAEMVAQLYKLPVHLRSGCRSTRAGGSLTRLRSRRALLPARTPPRLIDHASGWHDQRRRASVKSLHVYFKPYRFRRDKKGRAVILSEFGGYNLRLDGHCFSQSDFGYKKFQTAAALWQAYLRLFERRGAARHSARAVCRGIHPA